MKSYDNGFQRVRISDDGPKSTYGRWKLRNDIRAVAADRRRDEIARSDAKLKADDAAQASAGPPAGASPDVVKGWRR